MGTIRTPKFVIVAMILIASMVLAACSITIPDIGIKVDGTPVGPLEVGIKSLQQTPTPPAGPADADPKVDAPAPNVQPTPDLPKFEPTVYVEIRNWHQNPGAFDLKPGESANGGHIYVNDKEYLSVNDSVVVVTNNSTKPVSINSTDGVGVTNTTDFDLVVKMRFAEGCDPDGCSKVVWVNVTDDGQDARVVEK